MNNLAVPQYGGVECLNAAVLEALQFMIG